MAQRKLQAVICSFESETNPHPIGVLRRTAQASPKVTSLIEIVFVYVISQQS